MLIGARRALLALGVSLIVVGCAKSEDEEARTRALSAGAVDQLDLPGASAKPLDAAAQREVEVKREYGEKVYKPRRTVDVLEVDWDEVARAEKLDASALPPRSLEELEESTLPVLFPSTKAELLEDATLLAGPTWSTIRVDDGEHSIYIKGVRTSFEYPSLELSAEGDGVAQREFMISSTHQIVTLSFQRFGIGYTIDVECGAPMDDPRCTESDYAKSLYEAIAVLDGGAR